MANQREILELLAKNEEAVSQLYTIYAEKFSEWASFWQLVAADETAHALWIRNLAGYVDAGKLYFDQNRFKSEAILLFNTYIQEKITQAEGRRLSAKEAMNISYDMEKSLIEGKFFEAFESDHPDLKTSLQRLMQATQSHKEKFLQISKQMELES